MTPTDGAFDYTEGTFVGYRGHAAGLAAAPRFWFGAGLGYGDWDYQQAQVVAGTPDWSIVGPEVAVTLRNAAAVESREVVQVYFAPADHGQPVRLVGWTPVTVAPGEVSTVTVRCDSRMWRRWDTAADAWRQLDTAGELLVARGLGDIRLRVATT